MRSLRFLFHFCVLSSTLQIHANVFIEIVQTLYLPMGSRWKAAVKFPPPRALWRITQITVDFWVYVWTVSVLVVLHFFLWSTNCLTSPKILIGNSVGRKINSKNPT